MLEVLRTSLRMHKNIGVTNLWLIPTPFSDLRHQARIYLITNFYENECRKGQSF